MKTKIMDWTQFFICVTGVSGHILIARQDRRGYWFWIVGNLLIIKMSFEDSRFGMVGLFMFYTLVSLWALHSWKKVRKY